MKNVRIVHSVVLGCVVSSLIGRIEIEAHAQVNAQAPNIHVCADKNDVLRIAAPDAPCPKGQRSLILQTVLSGVEPEKPKDTTPNDITLDRAALDDINRRLSKLEELGCAALEKRKVVAPFEVVDRSGKTMFSVIENAVGLFNGGATPIAAIVADSSGAIFSAKGGNNRVTFGINSPYIAGLTLSEGGKRKIELGKSLEKGNYKLGFLSSSSQVIAGIGESSDTGTGLVLINDAQGKRRALMEVTHEGKGRIGIMSGGAKSIAAIGEGEQAGGVFYACAAGGSCSPVMVSAGTNENGVGVVATGPGFYAGGPTGAPGSFLVGKK